MQIEYIRGDLFSTSIRTIVHGCNAQGVMGAGIGAVIREQYPEAYKLYKDIYNSATDKHLSSLPLGAVYYSESRDKVILHAITQQFFGRDKQRYVSYDAVSDAMKRINSMSITEIAMPKIGAGLAGGDWTVISAIIESELKTVKPHVYIL
jgi:O-acetyl-ADP-ribose deacetylase (regulator of RNase III)